MQRVLSVSLSHAIRGAAFVLLPFAFVALIAWATAGSATGTTTDPIRGALWIWLGAHHIPFSIALPPSGISLTCLGEQWRYHFWQYGSPLKEALIDCKVTITI